MENNQNLGAGDDGETIEATEASGGQKTGHIRWVLRISTALAVMALFFVWFFTRH